MLSLKKLIDSLGDEHGSSRVVSILLRAVEIYTFSYEPARFAAFQTSISQLRAQFEAAHKEDDRVFAAAEVIRRLEEYSQGAEQFFTQQRHQTGETVRLLAESLTRVSHASGESARNLKSIAAQLEQASKLNDIAAMNQQLKVSLAALCDEAERQNRRQGTISFDLKSAGAAGGVRDKPAGTDPLTGLPDANSLAHAIVAVSKKDQPGRAVALAVERLDAINGRFGFKVGDQILLLFAQHIAQDLEADEPLFRWRGPCFVVLSGNRRPEGVFTRDMSKLSGMKLDHSISLGGRTLALPVTSSWGAFSIVSGGADEVLGKLEEFAASRDKGT